MCGVCPPIQRAVDVSEVVVIANVIESFAVDFESFRDIVEVEVYQIMKTMPQPLERTVLRAIEKEGIFPEFRKIGEGGSFWIWD